MGGIYLPDKRNIAFRADYPKMKDENHNGSAADMDELDDSITSSNERR